MAYELFINQLPVKDVKSILSVIVIKKEIIGEEEIMKAMTLIFQEMSKH